MTSETTKNMLESRNVGEHDSSRSKRVGRILVSEETDPPITVPDVNYPSFLLSQSANNTDGIAVIDATSERSYTYGYFRHLILSICTGLKESGVMPGDPVVVIMQNHIDMPAIMLAIMLRGAICVPVNSQLMAEDLVNVFNVSRAKWAIINGDLIQKVEKTLELLEHGIFKNIWVIDSSQSCMKWSSLESLKAYPESSEKVAHVDSAKTPVLMLFSTGTTGFPKGVLLSHRNMVSISMKLLAEKSSLNDTIGSYKSTLLVLPMCHIYGYLMMNATFLAEGKLVILNKKFTPDAFFKAVPIYKITMAPLTPHVWKNLLNFDFQKYDLSSLKSIMSGSGPIHGTTKIAIREKLGLPVLGCYGLTETTGIICSPVVSNPYSVGKLSPLYEAKIIDIDTGELLPERQTGELYVRGPTVMLGYANNPEATADSLDSDGWLRTGDLCYYNEEDHIYVVDRLKDLIKVKGFQVSPSELEVIIKQEKGVKDVAVAGVPHEKFGEAPKAWVVPEDGECIDKERLLKSVAARVAPFKQLAGGVEIVESLPKNFMNKLNRVALRNSATSYRSKL